MLTNAPSFLSISLIKIMTKGGRKQSRDRGEILLQACSLGSNSAGLPARG